MSISRWVKRKVAHKNSELVVFPILGFILTYVKMVDSSYAEGLAYVVCFAILLLLLSFITWNAIGGLFLGMSVFVGHIMGVMFYLFPKSTMLVLLLLFLYVRFGLNNLERTKRRTLRSI